MTTPHWKPGEQIALRELWRSNIWSARPATVVQDTPNLIALYLAPWMRWKQPHTPDGAEARIPSEEWSLKDGERIGQAGLRLATPGSFHSVILLWDEAGDFLCWYINLEDPLRRTRIGFDYMDQILDIVVSPDLSDWRWKDEDEFAEAQRRGIISPEKARQLRAEGERAIEAVLTRKPPFDQDWERWTPDPAWPIPVLPAGWDIIDQ